MEKADLRKGYRNPQIKMGIAMHFSERNCLEQRHFSEKEGKCISLQISLEVAFTYRN